MDVVQPPPAAKLSGPSLDASNEPKGPHSQIQQRQIMATIQDDDERLLAQMGYQQVYTPHLNDECRF